MEESNVQPVNSPVTVWQITSTGHSLASTCGMCKLPSAQRMLQYFSQKHCLQTFDIQSRAASLARSL